MANYNDYQLEDAENAAVQKSKNLKRGLAAGAAVLGVGTASAYGASKISEGMHQDNDDELTAEDLIAGAEAGADDTLSGEEHTHTHKTVVNENHIHIHKDDTAPVEEPVGNPELDVEETGLIYDENGDLVSTYDKGTYQGKDFVVMDMDGNGKGDIMAYDENGNGLFEDHEITYLDNQTYEIGQGEVLSVYQTDEYGNTQLLGQEYNPAISHQGHNHQDMMAYEEEEPGIQGIHNDFEDEKTGEVYGRDLAENNPDYNNNGAEQYSAGMDNSNDNDIAQYTTEENNDYSENSLTDNHATYEDTTTTYEEVNEVPDYGYTEPSNDYTAYDAPSDSFDDAAAYDA